MPLLRCLPTRRVELLACLIVVFAFTSLIRLSRPLGDMSPSLAILTLEALLPMALGVVAAGMLAGDPAAEILLTAHRPAWMVLGERMLWLSVIGCLTGLAVQSLILHWGVSLPKESTDQLFIWLSPLVFSLGLGSAAAHLRGRMLDGALAVSLVICASLLLISQYPRLCPQPEQDGACLAWLLSPTMTLGSAGDAYWGLNRLLWLGMGGLLLAISLRLARREEPFLHDES